MHADNYALNASQTKPDLICFSHLRWDFVYQRPQHLLKRSASDRRVFFVEEPVFDNGSMRLEVREREPNLTLLCRICRRDCAVKSRSYAVHA